MRKVIFLKQYADVNCPPMGSFKVKNISNAKERKAFIMQLLNDLKALEQMLKNGSFSDKTTRIGVEQELCLTDETWRTAPLAIEILKEIDDEHFTTELAKFNIEMNLNPQVFDGNCLEKVEKDLRALLLKAQNAAKKYNTKVLLTGILPTIRKSDIDIHNITPIPRYSELLDRMFETRGKLFDFRIKGVDELITQSHTVLFEACNTSIQAHLQVKPKDFALKYNWAQMISGPLLAACTNSPLLLGKRLWHETRIALFQQVVELSNLSTDLRENYSRATFGTGWVKSSVLEIFKNDIARYQVLLSDPQKEDSLKVISEGKIPKLRGLNLFNGTVYKWNRPCYGITNGVPHLRIECRYLPSGPTVIDEVANMAFWWGLMNNVPKEMKTIAKHYDFDNAKRNFFRGAHLSLNAQFTWFNNESIPAISLIEKLLDMAKVGLTNAGVNQKDINKYLGIVRERVRTEKTGSNWLLKSVEKMGKKTRKEDALVAATAAMYQRQQTSEPVHTWPLAKLKEAGNWNKRFKVVRQLMSTDLCTVDINDPIDYAANLMDWLGIHHLPVENSKKELVGLVTSGSLLKYYNEPKKIRLKLTLGDVMIKEVVTVAPNTELKDVLRIMIGNKIGSVPVLTKGKLVGIITEHDFMKILEHQFE
ncbi:MAG: CBS domain-containing protein [Bacteroidia bacterium]